MFDAAQNQKSAKSNVGLWKTLARETRYSLLGHYASELQHDLYLCFIDYAKAFDKVKHEDLFEFLQNLDIDGKDLRLIRNLYSEQLAAIRIDGNIGKYTQIRRSSTRMCFLSRLIQPLERKHPL